MADAEAGTPEEHRRTYRGILLVVGVLWTATSLGIPTYAWVLRSGTYDEEVRLATLLFGAAFGLVGVGLAYAAVAGEFVEEDGTTKLAVGGIKLEF